MRGRFCLWLLVALTAAPVAATDFLPIESRLTASGPMHALGDVAAHLELAGLRLTGGTLTGNLDAGTLVTLQQNELRATTSGDSPLGQGSHVSRAPDLETDQAPLAGVLAIRPALPGSFLLALPATGDDTIPFAWNRSLELVPGAVDVDRHNGTANARDRRLAPVEPYQSALLTLQGHRLNGDMLLLGSNVVLEAADGPRPFTCSDQDAPSTIWSTSTLRTCNLLVLYVQGGRFVLDGPAQASVARAHLSIVGGIKILGAEGPSSLDSSIYNGTASLFEAEGTFELTGEAQPGAEATWEIQGQATGLRIDARPVPLSFGTPAVVGGAAAVGLLALALALLRAPGLLLGFRATPDGNAVRRALLETVQASPGITLQRAAATLAVHKTTAKYHAQVLERHGLVRLHRLANRTHLSPPEADPSAIASAADWETRRYILASLRTMQGPVRVADLLFAWPGPSPPDRHLLRYHLRFLMRAGLVERNGLGRYTSWRLSSARPESAQSSMSEGKTPKPEGELAGASS